MKSLTLRVGHLYETTIKPHTLETMKKLTLLLTALALVASCATAENRAIQELESKILKAPELEQLSPDTAIELLRQGNINFATGNATQRNLQAQLAKSLKLGQAPKAIVLSCIDSRVPVEMIFDMGIGDIFVARVAGNVVSEDMLASMEYACKYIGSKVVLVLGHESCGAVNAACAGLEDGNLTELMGRMETAVILASEEGGDPFSKEFQSRAVRYNVEVMRERILQGSEILNSLAKENKIKIAGGVFNLSTGLVEFIE